MKTKQLIAILAAAAALTACGGGSGGGSGGGTITDQPNKTPVPEGGGTIDPNAGTGTPIALQLASTSLSIDELAQGEIEVSVASLLASASLITYSAQSSEPDIVSATVENGKVIIGALEVDREKSVTITITARSGTYSDSASIVIGVGNASARPLLKYTKTVEDNAYNLTSQSDIKKVASYFTKLSYFAGEQGKAAAEAALNNFEIDAGNDFGPVNTALTTMQGKLGQYNAGLIGDADLSAAQLVFAAAIDSYNSQIAARLTALAPSSVPLPDMAVFGTTIDPENNAVGYFVGSPAAGSFTDGEWAFGGAYAFLNNIAPASNTGSCPI